MGGDRLNGSPERGGTDGAASDPGGVGRRTRVAARYGNLARALPHGGAAAPTIHDAATAAVDHKGAGEPVDAGVAGRVGAHLGADFTDVRVHRDPLAQEASAAIGARAFAYGSDVFLGAGESGADLGLMAHELTHVVQQTGAGQRAPQRQVQVGAANSPAEAEADAVAGAVVAGGRPAQLLVDDGPVQPGQMLKSTFIAELRTQVIAAADAALGPFYSAIGCPQIDQYFGRYAGRPAAEGEAMLRRLAPATQRVATAADMIPLVVARVETGVRQWRDTGQVSPDLAALAPDAAGAATTPAAAQALRAPDGTESLASLEATLGAGQPLDGATASRMATALGADVSGARIHTGPEAARKAAEVDAVAFAVGPNVVMGAHAPSAGSLEGDALLAHELAHTVQQRDDAASPAARRQPLGAEAGAAEDHADLAAAGAVGQLHADHPEVVSRRPGVASRLLDSMTTAFQTSLRLQRCSTPLPSGSLTPGGSVAHTTGAQLDTYVSGSAAISTYVAPAIAAGRVATGHVHFLNPADFRTRWVAYAMARTNPATGARYTQAEAEADEPSTNAYRDGTEVYIHQDRGTPSTALHEGMHLYSSNTYRDQMGFNANEGTTEWLCRLVIAEQSLGFVRNNYPSQHASVVKLAAKGGNAAVMAAYFQGDIAGLRTAIDAATAAGTFDRWVTFMKASNYASADALM